MNGTVVRKDNYNVVNGVEGLWEDAAVISAGDVGEQAEANQILECPRNCRAHRVLAAFFGDLQIYTPKVRLLHFYTPNPIYYISLPLHAYRVQ